MNITPESIAEFAAMERPQTPQQALQNLDNVASNYTGTREEHYVLRGAIRTLQKVIVEHAKFLEQQGSKEPDNETAGSDGSADSE